MRLIDEFVAKVLVDDGAFALKDPKMNDIWYHFLQGREGEAKLVYGSRGYGEGFYLSFENKAEVVAIVAHGTVYIVDKYLLDVWNIPSEDSTLPKGAVDFYASYIRGLNDRVADVVFPAFYKTLVTVDVDIEDCRDRARKAMLNDDAERNTAAPCLTNGFGERDAVNILCGYYDADEEAMKRLEQDREKWSRRKSEHEKVMELIESGDGAEEWERRIADGLKSVDAVCVTVEFSMNGKTAVGKSTPKVITDRLVERRDFDTWKFVTSTQGEKVYKALGLSPRGNETPLKCEHIRRITYGRKVLYEREGE